VCKPIVSREEIHSDDGDGLYTVSEICLSEETGSSDDEILLSTYSSENI